MLVKSNPIKSDRKSERSNVHHLTGKLDENERIDVMAGSADDVNFAYDTAKIHGRKNAVQHFILSSDVTLDRYQVIDMARMLGQEFKFTPADVALMVRHTKERHESGGSPEHYHLLVNLVDPETGHVRNMSHSYARHEKVSRLFELKHGLSLTKGRHNRAVIAAVDDDAKARLEHLADGPLPQAAFSSSGKERCKRQGIDLAQVKHDLRDTWQRSDNWQAFTAAINEQGMIVRQGDKKPIPVIEKDGVVIGSASRLLGIKKADLERHMSVSGTQKAVEAGQDHDKAQIPDRHETALSGERQPFAKGVRKPAKVRHQKSGRSITDGMRPERVQSAARADLKGKSKEMQNVEIIAEELNEIQTKIINDQLAEQKKNQREYAEMVEYINKKIGDKAMNTITLSDDFKESCHAQIRSFEEEINLPLPNEEIAKFETLTKREKFDFAYAKVINIVKERKQNISKLQAEIDDLKSDRSVWSKDGKEIKSREAELKDASEKLAILCVYFAKKILAKLGLCEEPAMQLSTKDQVQMLAEYKTNKIAQAINEIADMKDTGYRKMAENGVKMMDEAIKIWKERPELDDAKKSIRRIEDLLDTDSFNERIADLSPDDIEKLKADIAKDNPMSAAQTIIDGELNAGDRREHERQKAAELAKKQEREKKGQELKNAKKKGIMMEMA